MIFYFSATGNSKYTAEKLQQSFGGELVSVADAMRKKQFAYETGKGEKIIFVFPVYFWNMPSNIEAFIKKVTFTGAGEPEICAVITCGSSIGACDKTFRKAFKAGGISVKAVYQLKMPDNCVNYFNLPNKEAQVMMLRSAEKELEEIIDSIRFNYRVSYKAKLTGRLMTKVCLPVYRNQCKTKKYWVKDNCIGCGLCQTVCPSGAITMEDGRPVWTKDKCVWCQGCINRCPVEAVQFGKKTEKRGRYIHPVFK